MTRSGEAIHNLPTVTTAPITCVSLCLEAIYRATDRSQHLPGIVALYGPAGWGKSTAAAYAANKTRAYYVAAKSVWTRKAFMLAILKEMGIRPGKTLYELSDQVAEQLAISGKPLIIDEMDHLVQNNGVELVRDIFESSGAPILIIGEEHLPNELKKFERFHSRVLVWQPVMPVTYEDAQHLARLYARDIEIKPDLLRRIHELANGSVRRVSVNIDMVREEALKMGAREMDLATWGDRELYTGEAPARRVR